MEEKIAETFVMTDEVKKEEYHFSHYSPKRLSEYIGQVPLQKKLHIYTQAALQRNEPLDHLLLFGAPGLGKTTLAHIIAKEMDVPIKLCSGPMLERSGDLVSILSSLSHKEVLFIDEIHRLPATVEEVLYTAIEEFRIDIILGQGVAAKTVSLDLSPFTLIGATTMSGKISAPLRSRFSIIEQLEPYSDQELQQIIINTAHVLPVSITDDAALLLAHASRATPRIAKKLLRRIRDFAQIQQKSVTPEFVTEILSTLGITKEGLTKQEIKLIETITHQFNGGPVGLETLAAILSEDEETVERVYEPFLMQKGYLEKTSRGRQIPKNRSVNSK